MPRIEWMTNDGGPNLLLPKEALVLYSGCQPPDDGRVIETPWRCDPDGPATDYDRACCAPEPVGLIDIGRHQGVVCHTDTFTAAVRSPRTGSIRLLDGLGWREADEAAVLIEQLDSIPDECFRPTKMAFESTDPDWVLIAAVDRYGESYGQLPVQVDCGRYEILTTDNEGDFIGRMVHWLRRSDRNS